MTRSAQHRRRGTTQGHENRAGGFRSQRGGVVMPVAVGLLVCACMASAVLVGTARPSQGSLGSVEVANLTSADATSSTTTTTAASGGSSTTTTTTAPDNPTVPAPAGFANQLVSLYGEIYTAATVVPAGSQSSQMMSPSDFEQQVDGLSASDLSDIYTGTSSIPNFDQMSTTFQQADTDGAQIVRDMHLSGAAAKKASSAIAAQVGQKAAGSSATRPKGHVSTSGLGALLTEPGDLTNYQPTSPIVLFPAASCPSGAPGIDYGETSIFSLQVAADVIAEVVAVIPDGLTTAFGNVTIPNIARIIVAAIQLGVVITHDTFVYLQAVMNDCSSTYLAALAGNTDSTAYNTFQELTDVAGTANEIDKNVASLINQDTSEFDQQLTLDIEQALSAPAGTVPMAAMELPQSAGGYLDSSPVGVNEVVTGAISAMESAGQSLNPLAKRDESLAEQAFSSNEFKLAFDYYALAYQAAAG
jgi:hypothetical protein